jgi:ribosomal-protein-alanine N-acetyltransferase
MDQKLKIRAYDPKDKPMLLDILKLNVPKYFAESEIDDLDNYLEQEVEKYYVAELDHQIIGAGGINFEENNKTAKISWDFVHPNIHGIGVGGALLRHRLDVLKSMKEVESITVRTSQLAYKFYAKNGFVLKEIVKDYWAEGFHLYQMIYE